MTLRADYLVDRRRLKRSVSLWRALAVIAVLGVIAVLTLQNDDVATALGYRSHIARLEISGLIQQDSKRLKLLKDIGESKSAKAVILRINSPGGTTVGGEALYTAILELREKKPVVAVFSTVATSAAYMTGIATDRIVARGSTITGSVGVILQWAEINELLAKLGVQMQEVRSGPLKAVPSPFRPLNEEGRELTRQMVDESKKWFIALVAKRRSIDPETVPGLTAGRIYSGREALKLKLIDQIGGEDEAIAWLEENRDVPKKLKIIDWKTSDSQSFGWFGAAITQVAAWTGLPVTVVNSVLGPGSALERVRLDGLISVWHAQQD
ncbi:MAG: signal peptide peptidase SppA [Hyphomicrobiaceae bacterium]|nr:signal peptide peptidase SppA [Hyphomicrobiaceae bacterium]